MQRGAVLDRLRASSAPALRVVGLTYTGMGGMIALALIVWVAMVPVAPALQQVAEPARQAVSSLVQPTSDAVTVFFGVTPAIHVESPASASSPNSVTAFSDVVRLDVSVEDAPTEPTTVDEPMPIVPTTVSRAPAAEAQSPAEEAVDEIVGVEPIEVSAPHAVAPVVVVVPVPTAGMQIASADPPKALPTAVPTETAAQIKARLDVENQAAIDAAKAAQVRAKAEADAANNAAIAALKAAAATTAATPVNTPVSVTAVPTTAATSVSAPTAKNKDSATPTATPQSKAAANAANQAAIDAAKTAQVRAKADANAANQAALLAAKGSKSSATVMPTPNTQLTAAIAPPPVVQPTPVSAVAAAGVTVAGQAQALSADSQDAENQAAGIDTGGIGPREDATLLENVPVNQASTLSEDGAA